MPVRASSPSSIDPTPHQLPHDFLGRHHDRNARRTWSVVALTLAMMIIEIIAGITYGSMALLADGVHMSTHAGALTIAALAYRYARRHQHDKRFAFGTGKVGDLAGFASAMGLGMVALLIAAESVGRLLNPVPVAFSDAILVAAVGLAVNLLSAFLLMQPHEHGNAADHVHDNVVDNGDTRDSADDHGHDPEPDDHHAHHHHHHADHNLIAAYVHVLADAVTSVLAIAALVAGRYLGWVWLDAAMGLVGAAVIMRWSYSLMRETGRVLLDSSDPALQRRVCALLERDDARVADLHIWRLGPGHSAVIASVVSAHAQEPGHFRARLASLPMLSHVTIEVHHDKS